LVGQAICLSQLGFATDTPAEGSGFRSFGPAQGGLPSETASCPYDGSPSAKETHPVATGDRAQRQQVTESFVRYISAIYADRSDSYAGQKLQVIGEQLAGAGVMVRSRIVKANGELVNVDYMMRRNGN
jgi:hypothetical protein